MSKESKPKPRSPVDIADHVWRFHEKEILPDNEVKAAYLWEYALGTPKANLIAKVLAARDELASIRKQQVRLLKKCGDPEPQKLLGWKLDQLKGLECDQESECCKPKDQPSSSVRFLVGCRDFPSKHWLELSQSVRDRIVNETPPRLLMDKMKARETSGIFASVSAQVTCRGDALTFRREGTFKGSMTLPTSPTKTPGGATADDGWFEYRLVTFSWARSDRQLKKDFAAWLKANRPQDLKALQSSATADSRRTSEREKLKYLGARRLMDHLNQDWNKAIEHTETRCVDKRGLGRGLFGEQSEWIRAKSKCNRAMKEFLALG